MHLLLGVLHVSDTPAARLLREHGIDGSGYGRPSEPPIRPTFAADRSRPVLPLDGGVDLVEQRRAVAEVEVLREVLVGLLARAAR